MYTVRGLVKNGAILLDEPVTAREGEAVLVTFMATAGHRALPGLEDVVAEIFTQGGIQEIMNLQPQGGKAKAYQVKQVRNVILRYRLADKERDE